MREFSWPFRGLPQASGWEEDRLVFPLEFSLGFTGIHWDLLEYTGVHGIHLDHTEYRLEHVAFPAPSCVGGSLTAPGP